jgi:hypothetical protein
VGAEGATQAVHVLKKLKRNAHSSTNSPTFLDLTIPLMFMKPGKFSVFKHVN